ncbi:hypothetical protein, partial [Mycobacterium montefiorense]|uniref:hypothetical protein n=1 Tax=Mycobacterium montefiorense TaxID=154654 RepID=UPI002231684B
AVSSASVSHTGGEDDRAGTPKSTIVISPALSSGHLNTHVLRCKPNDRNISGFGGSGLGADVAEEANTQSRQSHPTDDPMGN